ncbi:MAG: penicillin-binding protein [Desulfuromonadales bacterium]|nr:penicillin-binding protein [Desulfuromonadales bacterium]
MAPQEFKVYKRFRLVTFCLSVVFAIIIGRAFYLQVITTQKWGELAERQYHKTIRDESPRGTIFDQNHEPMALSIAVDMVYVEPRQSTSFTSDALEKEKRREAAAVLATTLSLPMTEMTKKLHSDKNYHLIKRQISPEEGALLRKRIKEKRLPWIGIKQEYRRYYPNAEVGAQLLGFTGQEHQGLEGLELKYNDLLLSKGKGLREGTKDNRGRVIGASREKGEESRPGSNLVLTINQKIQFIAEKELAEGLRTSGSKAGCVIVLDPATGKILALANQPGFNPNALAEYRPGDWRNRALGDAFEPGSTQKIFTVAAALNEKVITPGQLIHCENGSYKVGGKVIRDHAPLGLITITEILKHSSNIGSAKIGKKLERERLYKYLSDFGFGSATGIDLPGESRGRLHKPGKWYEIDLAAISFGQGLTVTPMQTAAAMAAIANHGVLMQPHVVEKIIAGDGSETIIAPKALRQVVSAETANIVRDMLMTVTEKGGTGTLAVVPGYRTAGKTGTAQKADAATRKYSVDKRVASFVGFIPAENPKLVIHVLLDEPKGQVYGGLIAAPIFSHVASQSLQLLGVPPTYPEDRNKILPSAETIARIMEKEGADEVAALDSHTFADIVSVDENGEAIPLEPIGPVMPSFFGLSSRQVLEMAQENQLNLKLIGSGRVIEQDPVAGMPIPLGSEIWVRLEPPSDRPILLEKSSK